MHALDRDRNKPVPEVQQIRDSVLAAYGFPGHQMRAEQKPTNKEQRGKEQDIRAAENETASRQRHIKGKRVAHRVQDVLHYVLSREAIPKRKRATNDKPDAAEIEDGRKQGHKRPRLEETDA